MWVARQGEVLGELGSDEETVGGGVRTDGVGVAVVSGV